MEPEGSLPRLWAPVTRPCLEPDNSSLVCSHSLENLFLSVCLFWQIARNSFTYPGFLFLVSIHDQVSVEYLLLLFLNCDEFCVVFTYDNFMIIFIFHWALQFLSCLKSLLTLWWFPHTVCFLNTVFMLPSVWLRSEKLADKTWHSFIWRHFIFCKWQRIHILT
jgi:hypothetical protein